jgi:lipopolysaccharide transport system permease protein
MPEPLKWILIMNPIADIMALIHAVTQGLAWDWGNVMRPVALWLLFLGPAWAIYHRAQPHIREML